MTAIEEIEEASVKLITLISEQSKLLPTKCHDKDATKAKMAENLKNLCDIIRAHISKYVFIVANCGGRGALDTAGQLTGGIELLVTSVRILRNKTSDNFSRKLIVCMESFLNQVEVLVRTLRKGEDASAITGMVWKHLEDLKSMKADPLEAAWKSFEDMQNRMKDVLAELKDLRDSCILLDGLEEEVKAADSEEDFDAFFDDGPEHFTAEGIGRIEFCISTINFFRKTFLDIYVWTKKGLKYKPERHDDWLNSLISCRKQFLRNLDMWGASLHEPQDLMEIQQESSHCLENFDDLVKKANELNSFARRKFVTRRRGKKVAGTGKEWFVRVSDDILQIQTRIHALRSESSV